MKFEQYLIEKESEELNTKLKDSDDYLKAPNGKDSNLPEKQWLMVRTKAFKKWFGDWETDKKNSSKIIDENGEPMICYHGTNADFDTFDKKKAGMGNDKGLRGKGFYMSPNKKTSMSYGSSLIEGFVNIRNPFIPEKFKSLSDIMSILDIEGSYEEDDFERMISFDEGDFRLYSSTSGNVTSMIKDAGFDGVLYIPKQEVIAFEPNQIKSINNKGSFGKTNNINESTESTSGFADSLKSKYGIQLSLIGRGDEVELVKIIVPKESRNDGVGTKVMKDIINWADDHKKIITLTPSSDFGGNKSKLIQFYKRFGFVENKDSFKDYEISDTMYRLDSNKRK